MTVASSTEVGQACGTSLRVGGFVPFSANDYPDKLSAVVFCQGCPWRCAYCHNPHLVPAHGPDERDFTRILAWLRSRAGLLDAVVFSGGEPTAQSLLGDAMDAVRQAGFAIGLHTAGAYPRRLAQVIARVDWVALDVKAPFADYARVTSVPGSGAATLESLDLVMRAGIDYEIRTTVHPHLVDAQGLETIAVALATRGVGRWILQRFRPIGCTNAELVASAPCESTFEPALVAALRRYVPDIRVRGADAGTFASAR